MNGEKAIIYARVSTEKQIDNTSLDAQVEECTKYIQRIGLVLTHTFRETFSGEYIYARPEFQRALQVIESENIRHMIVDVRDRLGRGDAIPIVEYILRNKGVEVHYVRGNVTEQTDPLAALAQHSVDVLVSGIERLKIRDRTCRGRENTVRSGKVMASHRPFGYSVKNGKLEIVEEEAHIVRQIFELFIIDKLSIREIRRRLYENKERTPGERMGRKVKFGSCVWASATIQHILKTETYAGVWHYLKKRELREEVGTALQRKVTDRPKSEQIAVQVPAIVTRATWLAAQKRLEVNREQWKGRPRKTEYLLRGFLYCKCGRKLQLNMRPHPENEKKKFLQFYYCSTAYIGLIENGCKNRTTIRLDKVEEMVWSYVRSLLLNPDMLTKGADAKRNAMKQKNQMIEQRVSMIGRELNTLTQKQAMLLDLYLEGDLPKEEYNSKKIELERKASSLSQERDEKQHWLEETELSAASAQQLRQFCEEVAIGIDNCTLEEKRRLLKLLSIRVTYDGTSLTIEGGVPLKKMSTSS